MRACHCTVRLALHCSACNTVGTGVGVVGQPICHATVASRTWRRRLQQQLQQPNHGQLLTCTATLSGLGMLGSGFVRPAICRPSRLLARLQGSEKQSNELPVPACPRLLHSNHETPGRVHGHGAQAPLQTSLSTARRAAGTPEGHVALAGGKGAGQIHAHQVQGHALTLAAESIGMGETGQGQENVC